MRAQLRRVERIAAGIQTFWFESERRMRFVAGQYLDMHLPHDNPDNRGATRTVTISSSPTEPLLGITSTFVAHHRSSTFKQALLALKSGDTVDLTDPMGDFVLPKDPAIPMVFIAGGIGITPVRSMVKWLTDTGEKRDVQLIYIARSPEGMPYLSLLKSYPHLQLRRWYTHTAPHGEPVRKRPTTKELLELIGDTTGKLIYLSGPEPMMESYWEELQKHGIPRDQLVLDYFTGYTQL